MVRDLVKTVYRLNVMNAHGHLSVEEAQLANDLHVSVVSTMNSTPNPLQLSRRTVRRVVSPAYGSSAVVDDVLLTARVPAAMTRDDSANAHLSITNPIHSNRRYGEVKQFEAPFLPGR